MIIISVFTRNKIAVKVTKMVKYAMALYHIINVMRSTFTWKVLGLLACFFQKVHNLY